MLAILTAQIGGGIFFAINYDDMMEKGLTESLRGVKFTSLYTFWNELQKDVRTEKKNVRRYIDVGLKFLISILFLLFS